MYDVLRSSISTCPCLSEADTAATSPEPDPTNMWLFTDPAAKVAYHFAQQLEALREDICVNVMFEGSWGPDEIELKRELCRLLAEEYLVPKGTFGYLSPHSTVYRARVEGKIHIANHELHFNADDDLLFVPWLVRVSRPGHDEPVHIGRLQTLRRLGLCSDIFPATQRLYGTNLAILHERIYGSRFQVD